MLFNRLTDIIEELRQVQREAEERFASSQDGQSAPPVPHANEDPGKGPGKEPGNVRHIRPRP